MNDFKKITTGFVIQEYEGENCISQEFIAGDQCDYEDQFGDTIQPPVFHTKSQCENYQSFDMVQPQKANEPIDKIAIEITVDSGVITSIDIPKSLSNVVVVVKDYDTDGADETEEDTNGEFVRTEWSNR
jgi:hypothetical protein